MTQDEVRNLQCLELARFDQVDYLGNEDRKYSPHFGEPAYRLQQAVAGKQVLGSMVIRFYKDHNTGELASEFPFNANLDGRLEGEAMKNRKLKETWAFGMGPIAIRCSLNGGHGVWVHLLVWEVEGKARYGKKYVNKFPIFIVQTLEHVKAISDVKAYSKRWDNLAQSDQQQFLLRAFETHEAWREQVLGKPHPLVTFEE